MSFSWLDDREPDEARLELVGALLRGLLAIGTAEPLRERDRLVEARPCARELSVLLVAVGEVQQRADAGASLWLATSFGHASA